MNAVEPITNDHRAVEKLFATFDSAEPERRQDTLAEIIKELSIHAGVEEAYLYPAVAEDVEDGAALVEEAEKEHQRVKEILGRVSGRD